jgi:O-antigen ligase
VAIAWLPVGLAGVGLVVLFTVASSGLAEYLFSRALYQERPLAGFGNPNFLGAALAHGLVIALALLLRPRGAPAPFPRRFVVLLAAILLLALVLSLSRAAMLYVGLAGFLLAVTLPRWRGPVLGAATTAVLALLLLPLPEWISLRLRFHAGTSGRTGLWEAGWNMMRDAPWVGVGPHQFEPVRYGYMDTETLYFLGGMRGGGAHNAFLHRGAELGVPGLVLVAGLFVALLLVVPRALGRHRNDWTAAMAGAGVVGLLAYSQFEVAATVGAASVSMNLVFFLYALVLLGVERTWPAERSAP